MMRSEIYSEEHQKLRETLKQERRAAGLRQQDIADKTNRSQEYISKFERGGLRLDVIDFLKFCEAIGCDPYKIIEKVGGPPLRMNYEDIRTLSPKTSAKNVKKLRIGKQTGIEKSRPPGMPPIEPD